MPKRLRFTVFSIGIAIFFGCQKKSVDINALSEAEKYSSRVAIEWMELFRKGIKSEGKNGPEASRIFAYAGIALYQSVLPGIYPNQSLEGQVKGFYNLPSPYNVGKLNYNLCANEALFQVYMKIFSTLKPENIELAKGLYSRYINENTSSEEKEVVLNSMQYGAGVAKAVLERSENDNYQQILKWPYVPPPLSENMGYWTLPGQAGEPIAPFWGKLKGFGLVNSPALPVPSTISFSTVSGSPFYNQAAEIVTITADLSPTQLEALLWWQDEPGSSSTLAGHWVSITNRVIADKNISLAKSSEVYAMLCMAMADAFISCWYEKYKVNLIRPVSYIRVHIPGQNQWNTKIPTPLYPEYPCGHSVCSAAAAEVLTHYLGTATFTDNSNTDLGYSAHTYKSFSDAALEASLSRLYAGVNFRESVQNGMIQGKAVSEAIFENIKMK